MLRKIRVFPYLQPCILNITFEKKIQLHNNAKNGYLNFVLLLYSDNIRSAKITKKAFQEIYQTNFQNLEITKVVIPTNLAYGTYILPLFLTDSVILPHLPLSTSLNEFNKNNFSVHYFPIFFVTFFNVVRIWNWKRFHYTLDDLYLIDIFIKTLTWCCQQLFLTMGKIPESSKKIDHVVKICFTLLNIVFNSCRMSFSII